MQVCTHYYVDKRNLEIKKELSSAISSAISRVVEEKQARTVLQEERVAIGLCFKVQFLGQRQYHSNKAVEVWHFDLCGWSQDPARATGSELSAVSLEPNPKLGSFNRYLFFIWKVCLSRLVKTEQ